ncbi:hypothetical protein [Desulforamulus hydrothermalis]|uniref:Uncharacterized protein n=1 Tax=Desulforamulus hydrothermalis Lam5 = DSM 18033 TaxID=1121428 RepID=K8DZ53_9FIRM|nr:hypothetical protein [Desulforamulus hydrothermalis]CCO08264.1 conserved hypothetical protein [Desulforamulus hydrothermalis Lam5 = DSM 18033]SHH37148.1 hypothetical protein SAMN02745177_02327 [Desulforamulus hydrothermalis Lam5 = DSM 18033]
MGKSKVNTHEIAKIAAREALKEFKEEERQRVKRTRYQNTELLLKNYLSLLDHYENSKDKASDIMELDDDMDEVIVKAIKKSRIRTAIMITQIETCLEILRLRMSAKGQPEKYQVIKSLYLDKARRDMPYGELVKVVAEEIHCGEATVRRWKKEMITELSVLIFGVDGLKLDI